MNTLKLLAACVAMTVAAGALAQTAPWAPPQNVLQLSAQGVVEVQQDLLQITLAATREGSEAAAVQTQLKGALDEALRAAKQQAQPGQLDVRTGNFSLSPRYTREGRISGWQGRAELILEGRDFARITQAAGRITTLAVAHTGFDLSREQRLASEAEAQNLAIENFRRKAGALARGFGFADYTLREVSVDASHGGGPVHPRALAASAPQAFAADAAVPVEAGKTVVTVTVSGSVQLR